MSYQRLYPNRINWEDEPSIATPVNQVNLNKMDAAIYGIDGRVVELDENKVDKTETFNTARNGVVPKPTQADITNEKVLRADGSWVAQSGGGGGGGGHTIVNPSGQNMNQRGKLQFTHDTGSDIVEITDDSENDKTIVNIKRRGHRIAKDNTIYTDRSRLKFIGADIEDDSVDNSTKVNVNGIDITYNDWKNLTEQEAGNNQYNITDFPNADGTAEIELMTTLWANNAPSAAFSAQRVTLNSDDYDLVLVQGILSTGGYTNRINCIAEKGTGGILHYNVQGTSFRERQFAFVDSTHIDFMNCYVDGAINNDGCVPLTIYGLKKKPTVAVSALAKDVSTSASQCMMSDGVTSVEEAITKNDFGAKVVITINQMYTFPSDGYLLVETTSVAGDYSALLLYGSTNNNVVSAAILRTPATNMSQATTVMVRKGMRCLLQNGNASFIPLT